MISKYVPVLLLLPGVFPPSAWAQPQNSTSPPLMSRQLTLAQAEELLRLRNLAVAANRHQLDASRAARLVAGFKPNPVLTLGAQQIPFVSNVPGSVPRFVSTNPDAGANPVFTMHVDKIIERGGKRGFRIEEADAVVDAAMAQIEDTLRTQRFQLRQAFVSALLARDNLQGAAQLQDQYAQTVTLTATRVRVGNLAPVELYRVQAANLPFRQAVLDAQNSYEQAARDLLNLLDVAPADVPPSGTQLESSGGLATGAQLLAVGLQPEALLAIAPVEVEGTFSNNPVMLSIAELRTLTLANRPDVQIARNNLRAAMSSNRLALAQRTRDVVVGAEYQRVGNDQAVGMTMQIPLFTYNNQGAVATQAAALERAAEAQLRQAERQALTDIEKAYQTYLAASRALSLYSDTNLKQVEDVRSITAYTYERGAVSLFELLDAERMARQTLVAYNQARAAYQLALFQLEEALGIPLP
jgi:outer membrane protein, heavy metal efflux system